MRCRAAVHSPDARTVMRRVILEASGMAFPTDAPILVVYAYLFILSRTEEEEDRDLRKFHSSKMLRKKAVVIPSLSATDQQEKENEEDTAPTIDEKGDAEQAAVDEKKLSK